MKLWFAAANAAARSTLSAGCSAIRIGVAVKAMAPPCEAAISVASALPGLAIIVPKNASSAQRLDIIALVRNRQLLAGDRDRAGGRQVAGGRQMTDDRGQIAASRLGAYPSSVVRPPSS